MNFDKEVKNNDGETAYAWAFKKNNN
jgi:hypothetical protein